MTVNLNKVELDQVIPENIDICDYKKSKDFTSCKVTVCGIRQEWEIKKSKEHTYNEMKKYAIKFSKSIKLRYDKDMEDKEIEEIVKDAEPMKRQDPEERIRRKGFVRGAVIQIFDKDTKTTSYNVLTGDYKVDVDNVSHFTGNDSIFIETTDGQYHNEFNCELITDVNKEIMRAVANEQRKIQLKANEFCDLIQQFLNNLIYDGEA